MRTVALSDAELRLIIRALRRHAVALAAKARARKRPAPEQGRQALELAQRLEQD
jgi:hypothetical protein